VSLVVLLIIGFVGAYITQLGDLVASALKRKVGIKDFSNVFPGHGGFMDRVDGLMFVSVFVYVVLTMVFIV
jgi:phosphatidate cytidylyltransferase